jgi:hypothetical protein
VLLNLLEFGMALHEAIDAPLFRRYGGLRGGSRLGAEGGAGGAGEARPSDRSVPPDNADRAQAAMKLAKGGAGAAILETREGVAWI